MNNEGQYKFDPEGRVSCVAPTATERPQREVQGDMFLHKLEQRALEAWHDEYANGGDDIDNAVNAGTLAMEAQEV